MPFPIMALMAIGQAAQAEGDARAQAIVNKYEAAQAQKVGEEMAADVRREGGFALGAAARALAQAGVSSTAGTGALILQDIKRRSESDAMAAVLSGKSRARALQFMSAQEKNNARAGLGASIGSFAMQGGFNGAASKVKGYFGNGA